MRLIKQTKLIVFFLVFIIIFNFVSALGVLPARSMIDFEPNLEKEGEFKLLNGNSVESKVVIYTENLIKGAVLDVFPSEVFFSEGQEEAIIKYKINLPGDIPLPGDHDIKIVSREIPSDARVEGTFIGASVAVIHQVRVRVPYPGMYANAELLITETGKTDKVDFIVALNNLGKENINGAKGIIDIYSAINDQKIATVESELFDVKSGERKEVIVEWIDGAGLGKYYAKLNVFYGENIATNFREFTIGKSFVEILYIYAKDFSLGSIAKFNILVENSWPEVISEVYTDFVFSQLGTEVDNFKSAEQDIPALSKEELTAFWDTEGIKEGEYDAKITLYYDDQKVEKNVKTKVTMNSIIFEGLSGAVVGDTRGVNGNLLIAFILIVILISSFWIVYFKFKKKK